MPSFHLSVNSTGMSVVTHTRMGEEASLSDWSRLNDMALIVMQHLACNLRIIWDSARPHHIWAGLSLRAPIFPFFFLG